jgi:hypothetical protein
MRTFLIYAQDVDAKGKREAAKKALRELWSERQGVLRPPQKAAATNALEGF